MTKQELRDEITEQKSIIRQAMAGYVENADEAIEEAEARIRNLLDELSDIAAGMLGQKNTI